MTTYYADDLITLLWGEVEQVAERIPPASVRTIVTSPPYYGLRDYDIEEESRDLQIGLEPRPEEYVERLARVFRALAPALTDDGTLWLNLGDSYGGTRGNLDQAPDNFRRHVGAATPGQAKRDTVRKQLLGIPWRVAFALQADGWILRRDIVWSKPNPMPESVTDRPTAAHEFVFLFAKNPTYYYDADAIAEPSTGRPSGNGFVREHQRTRGRGSARPWEPRETRNARDVWEISQTPYPDAHFATFPLGLPRRCIRAGSAPGDTVLDPFSGSGTTGQVATEEGRRYIGIDLSRNYLDQSIRNRFAQPVLNLTEGAS